MKKEIIEQLQEVAIEILKKSEDTPWNDLQQKVRELYEKITIQAYLSEQPVASTNSDGREKTDSEKETRETIAEPLIEKIKDIVAQMPSEGEKVDEILDEIITKKPQKNDLDDFAQHYKEMPVFERKENLKETKKEIIKEENATRSNEPTPPQQPKKNNDIPKKKSLNDKLNKSLNIGLNDRLAFTKHLFNENADDYHRVITQLSTFDTLEETQNFIETMVKPDYDWKGKEIYAERLLSLIEKKFD